MKDIKRSASSWPRNGYDIQSEMDSIRKIAERAESKGTNADVQAILDWESTREEEEGEEKEEEEEFPAWMCST
jgi:hypothetical protein